MCRPSETKAKRARPRRLLERCVFQRELLSRSVSGSDPQAAAADSFARSLLQSFVQVLAPDDCRLCNQPLLTAHLAPVCETCLQQMQPQQLALCSCCGESLGFEQRPSANQDEWLCTLCRRTPPPFKLARAYGSYEGTLRQAIRLMKFHQIPALADTLAPLLARAIAELQPDVNQRMTVVAVPLYRGKRSFNQSQRMADRAIRLLQKTQPAWKLTSHHRLLRRVRNTASQFQLSPRQRRQNLRNAFLVPSPKLVQGQHVLLVDDIYTTGATARECSRVLLVAGAASVSVVTLARAQKLTAMHWNPLSILRSTHPPSRN